MEIKERMLAKARELFHSYGVRSVTMDEIAGQLGVSKKTIYQYFSDKDELVYEVVDRMIANARRCCEENVRTSKDAVHELIQAIDSVQEIIVDMNPAMMYDLERFHQRAFKVFLDFRNNFMQTVIRNNLNRGIEEGFYRPDINVEIITKFRLEGMMLVFNPGIFPASKYNMAELHQASMEHFLFGVASLKGFRQIQKYQQERNKS